jgi:hypothetical protein
LSRHAKNELRTLDATLRDVEMAIADPIRIDSDPNGRPRYTSYIRGIRVRIVIAVDEPDLVVTIHERRN